MLPRFQKYIDDNKLFELDSYVICAVSGGIDSMVLLDLMIQSGFKVGVAHCNFKLRGEESDQDESFVKSIAGDYSVPYYGTSFQTREYARSKGISIQMAARELRMEWFEEIRRANGFDFVALAHQQNDVIETFFINLSRGTGIRGLIGMKAKNQYLVRPLLFASREEIIDYCKLQNLSYREDSSNDKEEYLRNKVRHSLIPVFQELNPRFNDSMIENMDRLWEVEQIFQQSISETLDRCAIRKHDEVYLSIQELKYLDPLATYLFEFIREFNFSKHDIPDIIGALDGPPGKVFYSATHRLLKDREELIVTPIEQPETYQYYIEDGTERIDKPVTLSFTLINKDELSEINKSPRYAYLDYDKVNFPLILRPWKKGEYFMPFGMKSLKKLSDFFINQKMSLVEKERTWILASDQHPVWIVGRRIDNRYRIGEETKRVLMVRLLN
jgi:tRNA(Ile)-lysidine synthase